jgi:hypothetical protein
VSAQAALELAAEIDLDGVPTCPLCLWELAWKIRDGERPSPSLVARTADWVWRESGEAVRAAVVRARMQEVPFAEEALRDLDVNGCDGAFARAIVLRLSRELAGELDPYSR